MNAKSNFLSFYCFKPEKDSIAVQSFSTRRDRAIVQQANSQQLRFYKDTCIMMFMMALLFFLFLPMCDNVTQRLVIQVAGGINIGWLEHLLDLKFWEITRSKESLSCTQGEKISMKTIIINLINVIIFCLPPQMKTCLLVSSVISVIWKNSAEVFICPYGKMYLFHYTTWQNWS